MDKPKCGHCGCNVLVRGCISLRCPLCGEYAFDKEADESQLWPEHKLGLLLKRGGWRFMSVLEPPSWFLENVV